MIQTLLLPGIQCKLTLFDLYQDPELIDEAKKEFDEETEGKDYETPLPENTEPPFDQFDK